MTEPEIQFRPESCPHLLWVLTPRYVTAINKLEGTSATLPMIAFWTEWHNGVDAGKWPSLERKKE
jgi:hypothetical protein